MLVWDRARFHLGKPLIEPDRDEHAAISISDGGATLASPRMPFDIKVLSDGCCRDPPLLSGSFRPPLGPPIRTAAAKAPMTPRAMGIRAADPAGATWSAAFSPESAARSCRCSMPELERRHSPAAKGHHAMALVILARWDSLRACGGPGVRRAAAACSAIGRRHLRLSSVKARPIS